MRPRTQSWFCSSFVVIQSVCVVTKSNKFTNFQLLFGGGVVVGARDEPRFDGKFHQR